MRATSAGLPLLLLWGCVDQEPLSSPVEDGAGILVFGLPEEEPTALAVANATQLPSLVARHGDALFLLGLEGGLAERGLEEGPLPLFPTGRRLPSPRSIHRLVVPSSEWETLDGLPDELSRLRIAEASGCGADSCRRLDEETLVCETPCPTTSPVEPLSAVQPPRIPAFVCPAGWTETSTLGPGCAPQPRQDCPDGHWQPLDASICQPLRACPGTAFRDPGAGPVAYVSSEAVAGGNGTEGAPFRSVTEALAATPMPATLSLGPGTYTVPAPLPDGLRLLGTCPTEVRIGTTVEPDNGALVTLEALTLLGPTAAVRASEGSVHARGIEVRTPLQLEGGGELRFAEARLHSGLRSRSTAQGRIVLERVVVSGEAALLGGTRLEVRGAAWTADDSSSALALAEDARAGLETVWFRADTGSRAALDARGRSILSGRGVFAEAVFLSVASDSATLTLEDSGAAGLNRAAALSGDARWTGRRLQLRARGGSTPLFSSALRSQTVVEASEVLARGPIIAFDATNTSAVDLSDLRVRGGGALLRIRGESAARVTRVHASGGIEAAPMFGGDLLGSYTGGENPCRISGLNAELQQVQLNADHVLIDGEPSAGLALCPGTVAHLRNVTVRGAEIGIYAECRGSCDTAGLITTVTAQQLSLEGDPDTGATGFFQRGGRLDLQGAVISGFADYGLYNWGSSIRAEDLIVEDIGERWTAEIVDFDRFCSVSQTGLFRGPASAIFTETWESRFALIQPTLTLERFRLRRAECAAITMGFDGTFEAQDGEISENRRGLNYIRLAEPIVGENVIFRANDLDIFRIL